MMILSLLDTPPPRIVIHGKCVREALCATTKDTFNTTRPFETLQVAEDVVESALLGESSLLNDIVYHKRMVTSKLQSIV
jgi:hypothetical protein